MAAALALATPMAAGQSAAAAPGATASTPAGLSLPAGIANLNPLEVLGSTAELLPGVSPRVDGPMPAPAPAGASGVRPGGMSAALNVMLLLTVITLAPSILLMCTCFVRILIVLALLRQALGTMTLPPPQVTTALALFTTALVMAPTVQRIHDEAVVPYRQGQIATYEELWDRGKQPVRDFMFAQIEATDNWSSVYMMLNYRGVDTSEPERLSRADVDMITLVPAFMLSELKTAFLLGFKIYLPFLVIDMVISTMLISMSMMMLPPVLISLPFKLLLFVLVDGWQLVVGSLMKSFAQPGMSEAAASLGRAAAELAGAWAAPLAARLGAVV
ncbi:flagellar type III secretion system pore protein FliP [Leptolyngbya sp. 15MV]|nr:flagellar type III secretion system pore protein FliP [Leptolyngbya sp. 15MV]